MVCFKVKGEGEISILEGPADCSTGARGEMGRGQARLHSAPPRWRRQRKPKELHLLGRKPGDDLSVEEDDILARNTE